MRIEIIAVVLLCCVVVACKKSGNTPPPPLPPPEEKTNCIPVLVSSDNGAGGYTQTQFFYNAKRQSDSSRNPFFFTKFYYQDTLLVKREVLFTSTRQVRSYDSLFYNTNGSLQKIKMFDVDDYTMFGVRDIVLSYTYNGNKLVSLVMSQESGNVWLDSQFEFTYDAKGNISDMKITRPNGDLAYAKYYYSNENNPFPRMKVPIGYFLHGAGLNRPGILIGMLPMFISDKKMNKTDDASGNIGVPVEISGGNGSGIGIKENNFTSYIISTECQ